MRALPAGVLAAIQDGRVIPAHPLALHEDGRFDEPCQRALTRYYAAAGSGGLAVGVHTTQFAIRDPRDRPVRAGPDDRGRRNGSRGRAARRAADPDRRRLRTHGSGPVAKRICWCASATTPGCSAWPRWPTRTMPRSSRTARRSAPASRSSASTCSPRSAADRCRTPSGAASPRYRPSSPSRSRRSTAIRPSTSSGPSSTPGATTSRSTPATTTPSSPTW